MCVVEGGGVAGLGDVCNGCTIASLVYYYYDDGKRCSYLRIVTTANYNVVTPSGVARGVHVGSCAPNPCTCAPILCMIV